MKTGWGQAEWGRDGWLGGQVKNARVHFIPFIINGTETVWFSVFQLPVNLARNHFAFPKPCGGDEQVPRRHGVGEQVVSNFAFGSWLVHRRFTVLAESTLWKHPVSSSHDDGVSWKGRGHLWRASG